MPSTLRRSPRKPKKPTKRRITLQMLPKTAFRTTPACAKSVGTSTAKRLRKTPRTDAKKCLGTVRMGQDGKYLYIAVPHRQRNPRYKTSRTSGVGSHITARWEKLYNQRTGKPIKVDDLPPSALMLL